MAAWSVGKRVTNLRLKYLPELGAYWRGTENEFTEFLIRTIDQMPPLVKDAMQRYYVGGESQHMNETGRPESTDSRYYLLLVQGRGILATQIKMAQNNPQALQMLEAIYGRQ